jgi:hypothetical protein
VLGLGGFDHPLKGDTTALAHPFRSYYSKIVVMKNQSVINNSLKDAVSDKYRKCTKCGDNKLVSQFAAKRGSHSNKEGINPICKVCSNKIQVLYSRTIGGLITKIYGSQKQSSNKRYHPLPIYSRSDLLVFAQKSIVFYMLFDSWKANGYSTESVPSFDRLFDHKGYSFDNFNEWMRWDANKKRGMDSIRKGTTKGGGIPQKIVVSTNIMTREQSTYHSLMEAERRTGVNHSKISMCCNHLRNKAGGYTWQFKNET